MQTQTNVQELMGCDVVDNDGSKVGTVKQVYLNDRTGAPEWVTVHTGWFGSRESFVPLTSAHSESGRLTVPYDKDTIKNAPNVNADEHLSQDQIVELYRHYGIRPPAGRRQNDERTAEQTAQRPMGQAVPGQAPRGGEAARERAAGDGMAGMPGMPGEQMAADQMAGERAPDRAAMEPGTDMLEVTRSEERLRIGTEQHELGRAHVRKWIETEAVEHKVPIMHEELRIEREPIVDGEAGGMAIGEDEQVIVLHEERAVVAKEAVPVERIRIRAERVEGEQTVRDELRKERVEVLHDDEGTPPAGRK